MVIAVTFQRLIEDASQGWSFEEDLVLQALRRSTRSLSDASPQEISDYLSGMTPEQLQGVASNVKGIYHELLFVEAENADWDEVSAKVKELTNQPGGDVEFIMDGQTVGEIQLKAVTSQADVMEHLARYPGIEIRVTDEVAAAMPGIASSGFSNSDLTRAVGDRLAELQGEGVLDEIGDGLATSALVSSAIIAGRVVRGKDLSGSQMRSILADAGVGAATAAVLDVLLFPLTS
ncbi:hypothetical protein AB9K35_18220 [Leisingera sp. XS_AS12]|uniref:hypothetical protein n=1 Tax=Leisingera sp. XS_AS12 TaxID=3241294 RepID=UPI0035129158